MKKINYYLLIISLTMLSGCVTQTTLPPDVYTLTAEQPDPVKREDDSSKNIVSTNRHVLRLAPIRAAHSFNTTDMIYSDSPFTQGSYAYSRWSDAPVVMLQSLVLSRLEKSHHFAAVIPPVSASKADLLLESVLTDFSHHINDDGTSTGVVSIRYYLIDNENKKIIATKIFTTIVPAPENNAYGAAVALNKASVNICNELIDWLNNAELH